MSLVPLGGRTIRRRRPQLRHYTEWRVPALYISVSQPPGRGPVTDPGINYTGPREVLLEFVTSIF